MNSTKSMDSMTWVTEVNSKTIGAAFIVLNYILRMFYNNAEAVNRFFDGESLCPEDARKNQDATRLRWRRRGAMTPSLSRPYFREVISEHQARCSRYQRTVRFRPLSNDSTGFHPSSRVILEQSMA